MRGEARGPEDRRGGLAPEVVVGEGRGGWRGHGGPGHHGGRGGGGGSAGVDAGRAASCRDGAARY